MPFLRTFAAGLLLSLAAHAADPPVIPVALDAYRLWDHWPYQQISAPRSS